jgi:hypothetical protein
VQQDLDRPVQQTWGAVERSKQAEFFQTLETVRSTAWIEPVSRYIAGPVEDRQGDPLFEELSWL